MEQLLEQLRALLLASEQREQEQNARISRLEQEVEQLKKQVIELESQTKEVDDRIDILESQVYDNELTINAISSGAIENTIKEMLTSEQVTSEQVTSDELSVRNAAQEPILLSSDDPEVDIEWIDPVEKEEVKELEPQEPQPTQREASRCLPEEPVPQVEAVSNRLPEEEKTQEPTPEPATEKSKLEASLQITDLRKGMSIGDRFLFQRELFVGNGEQMNRVIDELNNLQSLDEAMEYITRFDWDMDSSAAQLFVALLRRRW